MGEFVACLLRTKERKKTFLRVTHTKGEDLSEGLQKMSSLLQSKTLIYGWETRRILSCSRHEGKSLNGVANKINENNCYRK